ncbi:hypothetical protein BaRGS_00003117 [Batillaria attramentaria]|uniref:SAM domain-containing protein n=1 Tax=Batillaria attramentaria TaxID=370345 RepID=A0ABD0M3F6_9CAEN
MHSCRLSADHLPVFAYMNGATLYSFQNHTDLMEVIEIRSGLARKIIYLRDKPETSSRMLEWSVEDVVSFIQNTDRTFSLTIQNEVDGAAFLSLSSVKEMEQELGVKGMLAKRILVERNKFLQEEEKQKTTVKRLSEETASKLETGNPAETKVRESERARTPGSSSGSEQNSKEQLPTPGSTVLKKDDPFAHLMMTAQDILRLQYAGVPSDRKGIVDCELKVIYQKQKTLNELEQCFAFMILCKTDFAQVGGREVRSKLWDVITSKTHSHWIGELPQQRRGDFTVDNENVFYREKQVSFGKAADIAPKLSSLSEYERNVCKLDHFSKLILVIDKQLLKEDSQGYMFNLGSRKNPVNYCFGFDQSALYWTFDSEDFSMFEHGPMPAKVIGLLSRHTLKCVAEDQPEQLNPDLDGGTYARTSEDENQTAVALNQSQQFSEESLASNILPEPAANLEKTVEPRTFGDHEDSKVKYDRGILNVTERASSDLMKPSVELKLHARVDAKENVAKRAFLRKSLKFVCGGMNSRQNGTIYYGIPESSDDNNKDGLYAYGEIVGVEMSKELTEHYSAIFLEYLEKCFGDKAHTVRQCVKGPYFIEVNGTDPQRYVIEIDVNPRAEWCKDNVFAFSSQLIYKKYGDPPKGDRSKDGTGVCIRDVEDGKVVTKDLKETEKNEFVWKRLPCLCEKRKEAEREDDWNRKRTLTSEAEKLQMFITGYDESVYPILVIAKPTSAVKQYLSENLTFIRHIQWAAILDFDPDSDVDGLYKLYTSQPMAKMVTVVTVEELRSMTINEYRERFCFPDNIVWLFCNGKTTGEQSFPQLEMKEWRRQYFPKIKLFVSFFQDHSVIQPARHLVLFMISACAGEEIMKTGDEFVTTSNIGWEKVLFVFDHYHSQDQFCKHISEDILEHSAVLPWSHVQGVMSNVLDLKKKDDSKEVPSADTSAPLNIPSQKWQTWGDLYTLAANECSGCDLSDPKWKKKLAEEEVRFYNGGEVSWLNFCIELPNPDHHVMYRNVLSSIKEKVLESTNLPTGTLKSIPRVVVAHMPGAGGTTLGKHVLWHLKTKFKCAVVEKISKETERQICEFWESEECVSRQKLKPVILLLDNVTSDEPEMNESKLCHMLFVRQKSYQLTRPLAVAIICKQSVGKLKNAFFLTQKPEEDERAWLNGKSMKLEEGKKVHPEANFLGILSMRDGFDKTKLQTMIVHYLNHTSLEIVERKLIIYIALVMKYFPSSQGKPGIPVESCEKMFESGLSARLPWEKRVSSVAGALLVQEYEKNIKNVVRLANSACAEAVLSIVLNNDLTLADLVEEFLRSPLVTGLAQLEENAKKITTNIFRNVLLERKRAFTEDEKDTEMSPLILDIEKLNGFQRAVDVLLLGYQSLGGEAFNQQLARFYRDHDMFDEAVHYASAATDNEPSAATDQ